MSWDDFKDKPSKEEKAKEPIYRHTGQGHYYVVFRVGRRLKNIGSISNFKRHMQRQIDVINANKDIQNIIIIGNENITEDVAKYLQGVKMRKDSVYATELLLTASPGFFQGISKSELEKWEQLNKDWLLKEFGDNLRYAVLHLDESTPHIHALVVPVFENDKGLRVLANKRYFGGREKLRRYQDVYADEMKATFKSLNRGIKFSKAKNIAVRHFYALVNQQLNENDLQQLCAKAKDRDLMYVKLKAIQNTFNAYQNYSRKTDAEKQQLIENNLVLKKNLKELKQNQEVFHTAIELMSQQYKLPQNAVKQALKYAENSLNNERER